MIIKTNLWQWLVFLVFLASGAVVICALLFLSLQGQVHTNHELVKKLSATDAQLAQAQEEAQLRERALLLAVQALQGQVRSLGGTPLPLPPGLQTTPSGCCSSGSGSGGSTKRSQATPSPTPTRSSPSPTPRPTPSTTPRPTSSPSCAVSVGPVCIRP